MITREQPTFIKEFFLSIHCLLVANRNSFNKSLCFLLSFAIFLNSLYSHTLFYKLEKERERRCVYKKGMRIRGINWKIGDYTSFIKIKVQKIGSYLSNTRF